MSTACIWAKRYLVWAVTDFDGLGLRKNILPEEFTVREPFRTSRLVVPAGDWTFPLKARYEHTNTSIEGDADRAASSGAEVLSLPPDNADPADQE